MNRSRAEQARRTAALMLVLGGWLGSLSLGLWAVLEFNPAKGHFAPQWVGLGYIGLLGIAIAASAARSRMRLTDTIVAAFKAGQEVADDRWEMVIRAGTGGADELTHELDEIENGHNGDHA